MIVPAAAAAADVSRERLLIESVTSELLANSVVSQWFCLAECHGALAGMGIDIFAGSDDISQIDPVHIKYHYD
jgi:hypothetical protein